MTKKKNKFMRILLPVLLIVALVAAGLYAYNLVRTDVAGERGSSAKYTLVIEDNDFAYEIGAKLKNAGMIKSDTVWTWWMDRNYPDFTYYNGEYYLNAGMSYQDLAEKLQNPDISHKKVKVTIPEGYKLSDELEEKIEDVVLFGHNDVPRKTHGEIGKVSYVAPKASEDYIDHLESTIDSTLGGLRILVDCANGASYTTAARLFDLFPKLQTDVINADPDGVNINEKCGSTHMDALAAMVRAGGYDIGIAFDGDADRCLAVDERGELIDGDQIMAACGLDMKRKGKLPGNAVVATVMSNLGLHLFAKEHGMDLECTSVGDRNVLERMLEKGYAIGGEQSGHMIFLEHATTGDGQLTALQVLALLKESGKRASEVFGICQRYPQVLINIPVADNDRKKAVMASQALADAVAAEEEKLAGEGRVLVRPSGTEALMRVMVEARDQDTAQAAAQRLADQIAAL